jgi:hypothetical protein
MMQSNLRIKRYINYSKDEWDRLLLNFKATINYTAWFLNYVEILNIASEIQNFTFVLYETHRPIAIVPLYVEKINGQFQISMGQEPVFAPIFNSNIVTSNISENIEYIVNQIDKVACINNCILARFNFSPLINYNFLPNEYFKYGYDENIFYPDWYIFKSNSSFVLNLANSKESIFNNIRKGHKSNIKQTQKIANLILLDEDSYNEELFNSYIDLYYKAKGNKRSADAFKLDSLAINSGLQFIMICEFQDKLIGAIAFHIYNNKARYNSSIQIYNNTLRIHPTHFLLWSGIEYLINKGYTLLEIGEQVIESEHNSASLKEKNLSHFKAGWGCDLISNNKIQKEFKNV